MQKKVNYQQLVVNEDEFTVTTHADYHNLKIIEDLPVQEKMIGLINDLRDVFTVEPNLIYFGYSHGGFMPIKTASTYKNSFIKTFDNTHYRNLQNNIDSKIILKEFDNFLPESIYVFHPSIYINDYIEKNIVESRSIIICKDDIKCSHISYSITDSPYRIYIPIQLYGNFLKQFHYYIQDDDLNYDNLVHLAMIVKNGGDELVEMLKANLPNIDRWTILDTGSTDNTIENIKKIMSSKKGELFCEPFVDFATTRNRCLELCGKKCKFIIMLDDTYICRGDFRKFLNSIRSDQFGDSYSIYIKSHDTEYVSNRIIKSEKGLRYLFKIHEVIDPENNVNVCIPLNTTWIEDINSEYMRKRTFDRKHRDLEMLFEMIKEEPENPRHYYYVAQTYNLLNNYDKSYEFYLKRAEMEGGFVQERLDACFEAARTLNFRLNGDWKKCEELYKKSYELDTTRPEPLYFLGIHYYLENNFSQAYDYFSKAFNLGYPENSQYSLKPSLVYHYLPKFLCELCLQFKNYSLGLESANRFIKHNGQDSECYTTMVFWEKIFRNFSNDKPAGMATPSELPYLCIIADGGFDKWSGGDILKKGLGGSETSLIELTRRVSDYKVVVFCKCDNKETFENVDYYPIENVYDFISSNNIKHCIVSRYLEYVPLCLQKVNIENVYIMLHDVLLQGTIIPIDPKIKKIFCVSDWHAKEVERSFPQFKDIITVLGHGIDISQFKRENKIEKVPYRFIYTSLADRGLLYLLKMWKTIKSRYPSATLYVHSDLDNIWMKNFNNDVRLEIKSLLQQHGIVYKGLTKKSDLVESWLSSHIWFYPCSYPETFCISALECAASRTLAVTTDMAALPEVIGDAGVILKGDPSSDEWMEKAINILSGVIAKPELQNKLLQQGYDNLESRNWNGISKTFVEILKSFESFDIEKKLKEVLSDPKKISKLSEFLKSL